MKITETMAQPKFIILNNASTNEQEPDRAYEVEVNKIDFLESSPSSESTLVHLSNGRTISVDETTEEIKDAIDALFKP